MSRAFVSCTVLPVQGEPVTRCPSVVGAPSAGLNQPLCRPLNLRIADDFDKYEFGRSRGCGA